MSNEPYYTLGEFYANIVKKDLNTANYNDEECNLRLLNTKYLLLFEFPEEYRDYNNETQINRINPWINDRTKMSKLDDLINYLLQDLVLPSVSYDGLNGGDVAFTSSLLGGFGGSFNTPNESDIYPEESATLTMKFLDTKYSLVDRYFIPWIEHSVDMQSAIRHNVYPFVKANLRIYIYDESTESILSDYTFFDVYPFKATLPALHISSVELSSVPIRTVDFSFNSFVINRESDNYASEIQMFKNRRDMVFTLDEQVGGGAITDNRVNVNTPQYVVPPRVARWIPGGDRVWQNIGNAWNDLFGSRR